MKRIFTVVTVVLGFGIAAFAQEQGAKPPEISVEFSGVTVHDAVMGVCQAHKLDCNVSQGNAVATREDGKIMVARSEDAATISEMVHRRVLGDVLFEETLRQQTQPALVSATQPYVATPPEDAYTISQQVHQRVWYGGYGYYYPGFDLCVANPGHRDCTHGVLKLDGETRFLGLLFGKGEAFLREVDVYVDRKNYGPASKKNNVWNAGITVGVGNHTVQFLRVAENLVLYEDQIRVDSRWVTRGHPNVLRVDRNHFKNAPFLMKVERQKKKGKVRAEDILR